MNRSIAILRSALFPLVFKQSWPKDCRTLFLDFDGVITDDAVITSSEGVEYVRSSRSDGMGVERLIANGFRITVISKERNPVVSARCEKLGIAAVQGVDDKLATLTELVRCENVDLSQVCFVGNDINDIACLKSVGFGCVVLDAHPHVFKHARAVIPRKGGNGAIRLLSDFILKSKPS